jgi:hypothetical protein
MASPWYENEVKSHPAASLVVYWIEPEKAR